jgi:hypothetical protein
MQAVLKRKTEEAEAARRKLRDLLELQARVRRDKRPGQGQGTDERGKMQRRQGNAKRDAADIEPALQASTYN